MTHSIGDSARSMPSSPELMTTEWMNQALSGSTVAPGESIRAVQILDTKTGKGDSGQVARFELQYHGQAPGLKKTILAKFSTPRPKGRFLRTYEREVLFFNEVAPEVSPLCPQCYYAAYDPDSGKSLILMEDLDGFRNGSWLAGCTPALAGQAVRQIARLHARYWENTTITGMNWLFQTNLVWPNGIAKASEHLWETICQKMRLGDPAAVQRAGEFVQENVDWVMQVLSSPPLTLIHNDFQLDNLLFGAENGQKPMVISDWALLGRGKGISDIAFLLCGNLSPEDRRSYELGLLREYWIALSSLGVRGYSFEACMAEYHQAAILNFWRLLYAIDSIGAYIESWTPVVSRYLSALSDFYF